MPIEKMDLADLRDHLLAIKRGVPLTGADIENILKSCGALWMYREPACPERPHALMRSGAHTNFFINCLQALKETIVLEVLAEQCIIRCADLIHKKMTRDDWVIGAERAGAPVCQEVARQLGCRYATVEKDRSGNPTVFNRFEIEDGETAFFVNDLLSHPDGSTHMSIVAVQEAFPDAVVLPVAMHLVNRSGRSQLVDGTSVRALTNYVPSEYPPDDCPICRAGSEAMSFKANQDLFLSA